MSFTGFSTNDVFWEIFSSATGQKLGESKFHLSCSDSNMNGSEDCVKPQGNGKDDNSSNLDDWLLEGIQGEGGVLDCTSDEATAARLDVSSEECGLGFELAFILPGLTWLYGRR